MAIELGILFSATDKASQTVSGLEKRFGSLDKMLSQSQKNFKKHAVAFGVGLATMTAGAKLASIPLSFVKTAGNFEASLVKMSSVTGIVGQDLETLKSKALELGVATQFSPDQAIEGMKTLGTAGLNAGQVLKAIEPTLLFAGASQGALNVQQASSTLVAATNAFSIGFENAGKTVDKMTRITQLSSLGFGDLETVIASTGSVAKATGNSFSTFLATVGAIKGQGGTALDAAAKLRGGLNALQSGSKPAQKALDAMGLSLAKLRAPSGKFLEIPDLFDKINNGLKKITRSTAQETAVAREQALVKTLGVEGVQAFNKVMSATFSQVLPDGTIKILKGTEAVRAMTNELNSSEGTAKSANKAFLESFEGIQELLRGTLETIKITLGLPLLGIVSKGLGFVLNNILNPFLSTLQKYPVVAKLVSGGLLAIGTALTVIGGAIAGVAGLALLKTSLLALGITGGSVAGAISFAFTSILAPIALITGAMLTMKIAWDQNLGGIQQKAKTVFSGLNLLFQAFTQLVSGKPIGAELTKQLDSAGLLEFVNKTQNVVRNVIGVIKGFVTGFTTVLFGVKSSIFDTFAPVGQQISNIFNSLASTIGNIFSPLQSLSGIDFTKNFMAGGQAGIQFGQMVMSFAKPLASLLTALIPILGQVGSSVGSLLLKAATAIAPIFGTITQGATTLISGLVSKAPSAINAIAPVASGIVSFVSGAFNTILNAVSPIVSGIQGLVSGLGTGIQSTFQAFGGFDAIAQPVQSLFSALQSLGSAISSLLGNVEGLSGSAQNSANSFSAFQIVGQFIGTTITGVIIPAFQAVVSIATGLVNAITFVVNIFNALGSTGQNILFGLIAAFNPLIGIPLLVAANWQTITSVFRLVGTVGQVIVTGLIAVWTGLVAPVLGAITGLVGSILSVLGTIVTGAAGIVGQIVSAFTGLVSNLVSIATTAGSGFVSALSSGILNGIGKIISSVKSKLSGLRRLLPSSDAKEGALSDLTHSGKMFGVTFAKGIDQGSDFPVRAVMDSLKPLGNLGTNLATSVQGQAPINQPFMKTSDVTSVSKDNFAPIRPVENTQQPQVIQPIIPQTRESGGKMIQVVLQVDGRTLAEQMVKVEDDELQRSFVI